MTRRACLSSSLLLTVLLVVVATTQTVAKTAVTDSVRKYKFLGKTARELANSHRSLAVDQLNKAAQERDESRAAALRQQATENFKRAKSDHVDVVDYYTRLLTFKKDYHLAHYYTARAQLALGNQEAAKAALLSAVALKPRHANTNLLLFQVYSGQNKPDSAWAHLGPLVAANPGQAKYRAYRRTIADLYRRAGKVTTAIGHYEAIAEDAATPEGMQRQLRELLAVLYDDLGDVSQALVWRKKLAGGSEVEVESLSKMVDLQIETKDYKGACATLETLTRIDSAGRYSHFHRMFELGEISADRAMELAGLEGMASCQPKDLETVAIIAQIHLNRNDLKAVDTWLHRGLKQAPTNAQLRVLLGDLLVRYEAPEDSVIAEYEVALHDPNWASVAQQRIWKIRPPETEEEKLKKSFFGQSSAEDDGGS